LEINSEIHSKTDESSDLLLFKYFPDFASFILENHLDEYIMEQLVLSRKLDLPLLKFFTHMSDEEIMVIGRISHGDFLRNAANNTLSQLLNESLQKWKDDNLEGIRQNQIASEDIHVGAYIRKQALLKFLPLYTSDASQMLAIINEIDEYDRESNLAASKVHTGILHEEIQTQLREVNKSRHQLMEAQVMTETANYEVDVESGKVTASPNFAQLTDFENGFDLADYMAQIVPEDREKVEAALNKAVEEDGSYDYEYRFNRNGELRYMCSRGDVVTEEGRKILRGTLMDITERNKMLQKLKRSDALYKQAEALSHLGNWNWDLKTGKLEWSDELYRIYGLQPGTEIIPDNIRSFNHPEDAAMVMDTMALAVKNLQPYNFHYRIVLQDGTTKILEAAGEVVTDKKGEPTHMVGTLQDVTEKHKLIKKLRESETLYKQAQAISKIGNWDWDIATNEICWSEELYRIFGLDAEKHTITFEMYASFIHEKDRKDVLASIRHSADTGEAFENYYTIVLGDGTEKVIHSRGEVVTDSERKVYKMYGTCQDVTFEKEIENNLKQSQAFVQKVADTTPSLIALYNINTGVYSFVNKAIESQLGYSTRDVFERGAAMFADIIHPDDFGPTMEKNAKALEEANANVPADGNEVVVSFKYRMRHKNGQYKWFQTYGTIFGRDNEGKVQQVLNVSIDITEQMEAEFALQQKNVQLQQSNTSLEEFAYVASHDLKEPLRKIATFGDRLNTSNRERLDDNGKLYLEKIIDSSRRMQTMINDLLSVSVIAGNKSYEKHDLSELLSYVLKTLDLKIEQKNAKVIVDELPSLYVVPSQIRQLFQNLISNSLKFTKPGVPPEIHISSSNVSRSEADSYNLNPIYKYKKVTFKDNGIGFDNQYSNKIFTIFQRLHNKTEYEGNGIGLSICRKIVENHEGVITATSSPGHGATFNIIIPVK
jgi:PAS domain S-box-containing protein